MPILIITGWEVAIRECEYKNFSALICGTPRATGYATQQAISRFLTATCSSLTELMDYSDHDFEQLKQQIAEKSRNMFFFEDLEFCRKIVRHNMPGANIIRYLLLHLNNIVLKKQWQSLKNPSLSNLHLQNGCIPFDRMPSIHKAQGLEYRSVKIVITDEVDEMISHSIFYTAITRARERLKIYWTPEVENKVLSNMAPMDRKKDVGILRKFGL